MKLAYRLMALRISCTKRGIDTKRAKEICMETLLSEFPHFEENLVIGRIEKSFQHELKNRTRAPKWT